MHGRSSSKLWQNAHCMGAILTIHDKCNETNFISCTDRPRPVLFVSDESLPWCLIASSPIRFNVVLVFGHLFDRRRPWKCFSWVECCRRDPYTSDVMVMAPSFHSLSSTLDVLDLLASKAHGTRPATILGGHIRTDFEDLVVAEPMESIQPYQSPPTSLRQIRTIACRLDRQPQESIYRSIDIPSDTYSGRPFLLGRT